MDICLLLLHASSDAQGSPVVKTALRSVDAIAASLSDPISKLLKDSTRSPSSLNDAVRLLMEATSNESKPRIVIEDTRGALCTALCLVVHFKHVASQDGFTASSADRREFIEAGLACSVNFLTEVISSIQSLGGSAVEKLICGERNGAQGDSSREILKQYASSRIFGDQSFSGTQNLSLCFREIVFGLCEKRISSIDGKLSSKIQRDALRATCIGFSVIFPTTREQSEFLGNILGKTSTGSEDNDPLGAAGKILMAEQMPRMRRVAFWEKLMHNADGSQIQSISNLMSKMVRLLVESESRGIVDALLCAQHLTLHGALDRGDAKFVDIFGSYAGTAFAICADIAQSPGFLSGTFSGVFLSGIVRICTLAIMGLNGAHALSVSTRALPFLKNMLTSLARSSYKDNTKVRDLLRAAARAAGHLAACATIGPDVGAREQEAVAALGDLLKGGWKTRDGYLPVIEGIVNGSQSESGSAALKLGSGLIDALEIVSPIKKTDKMRFRRKAGADMVWRALRCCYAALLWHSKSAWVFRDAPASLSSLIPLWKSSMSILKTMSKQKQTSGLGYAEIGANLEAKCKFLLQAQPFFGGEAFIAPNEDCGSGIWEDGVKLLGKKFKSRATDDDDEQSRVRVMLLRFLESDADVSLLEEDLALQDQRAQTRLLGLNCFDAMLTPEANLPPHCRRVILASLRCGLSARNLPLQPIPLCSPNAGHPRTASSSELVLKSSWHVRGLECIDEARRKDIGELYLKVLQTASMDTSQAAVAVLNTVDWSQAADTEASAAEGFFSTILSTIQTSASDSCDETPLRTPRVPFPQYWSRKVFPTSPSVHWMATSECEYVCSHGIMSGIAYIELPLTSSQHLALHFGLVGVDDYAASSYVSDSMLAACIVPASSAQTIGIVYDFDIQVMAVFRFNSGRNVDVKARIFSWDSAVCIRKIKSAAHEDFDSESAPLYFPTFSTMDSTVSGQTITQQTSFF